jgi:hypothetical protein
MELARLFSECKLEAPRRILGRDSKFFSYVRAFSMDALVWRVSSSEYIK